MLATNTQPDPPPSPSSTILVVDDESGILEAYQHYLAPVARPRGITSHRLPRQSPAAETSIARLLTASSGERAVELVRAELAAGGRIQAAFFDMRMPGGIDGLETMRRILALDPEVMCIVVTAYSDQPLDEIRALFGPERRDDWDYLNKPFNGNEVIQKARNAASSWWRRRREAEQATALLQTNAGLESRIAERTQSLVEANAELERSHAAMAAVLADLREANDRLRVEMAEHARLEDERRLSSKLESVGQLAAGIAHEINTPTQYILSNAEMLEHALHEWLPEIDSVVTATAECASDEAVRDRARRMVSGLPDFGTELDESVESILTGAKSIARIVGAMREFARIDAPEMRPADLNRAVSATLEVVRYEYRQIAEIELTLGELPQVHCHVGEIQQVLANLIVNAAHAIDCREPRMPGRIRIQSRHDKTRGRVEISVADNGIGISPEHRERVFDPFFTTKPVGRGTGQGLAITRNVVMRHGGSLTFSTQVGVGTEFVVALPVLGPTADTA